MQPLNPTLANAVLNAIQQDRLDAAAHHAAAPVRRSPFGGLRRRAAARRGGSPTAASRSPVPARATHA